MAGKNAGQSGRALARVPSAGDRVPSRGTPRGGRAVFEQLARDYPAPVLRSGSVRRADRLGALADIDQSVVVVSAPPGYGKTTLIAEWAEMDERLFLYLSLKGRAETRRVPRCLARPYRGDDRTARGSAAHRCPR